MARFPDAINRMNREVMAVFGETEPIDYIASESGVHRIHGIYDEGYVEVTPGGVVINSGRPRLFVLLNDFKRSPSNQDRVIVRGREFRIINSEKDGQGGAWLELHKI